MEQYDGFTTKVTKGIYQTVVKEFNEKNGYWEEVIYNTVNGIDYVESRRMLPDMGVSKPSTLPTKDVIPTKPTTVSKPVFSMSPPIKPTAFVEPMVKEQEVNTTPGPVGNISNEATMKTMATESKAKHIYAYGLKNIGISHTSYESSGVFVSKPMKVKGNLVELSLLANEEHPLFDSLNGKASSRMTSVEYYIAYKANPNANDWLPILPESQEAILCERLFFVNSTAPLRFHAKLSTQNETVVYKNGVKMDKAKWCYTEKGASLQLLENRDLTAIYTIDYTPDPVYYNPWVLNIKNKGSERRTQTDLFEDGTSANKSVTLSQYPFVDYDTINGLKTYNPNTHAYQPFKVYLQKGEIAIGGGKNVPSVFPQLNASVDAPFTKNVTDYKKAKDIDLKAYSLDSTSKYLGFEYKQERNKLIFSETFNRAEIVNNEKESHGNSAILVEYQYLETDFRIKIIVRKNSGNNVVMSPRVNDYQIKFKVMK